jgi:capsular exopolysaccharide synthesis family protein
MHEALRKAAEERERRRHKADLTKDPVAAPSLAVARPEAQPSVAATQALVAERPAIARPMDRTAPVSGGRALRAIEKHEREAAGDSAGVLHHLPRQAQGVDSRVVAFHRPRDPRTEQFRNIRAALLALDPVPRSLLVTSGCPAEGKSIAAANLAATMAEAGARRVLVIDANLRHPEMDALLAARTGAGLSDILDGRVEDLRSSIQTTPIAGVDLLSCGTVLENPGGLLQPRRFSGVVGILEETYDFIIVDSPSLEEFADAAVLAPEVDGVILAVKLAGPSRANAERALEVLDSARARVLGTIATNCRR